MTCVARRATIQQDGPLAILVESDRIATHDTHTNELTVVRVTRWCFIRLPDGRPFCTALTRRV